MESCGGRISVSKSALDSELSLIFMKKIAAVIDFPSSPVVRKGGAEEGAPDILGRIPVPNPARSFKTIITIRKCNAIDEDCA